MIAKVLHTDFFTPTRLKIPATSVKIPTAAEMIAEILSVKTAVIAETGDQIPQMM